MSDQEIKDNELQYAEDNVGTEESAVSPESTDTSDALQKAEQQIAELKDKYIRLVAEFENFRRRTAKENLEIRKLAASDTITALLPVLDDFDRAKKTADTPGSPEVFTEGIALVYHKLYQILQQLGVRKMESDGTAFDTEQHEAITEIPVADEQMKGKVVDTVEHGYFLHDKIIRYAKVVVGK